jgi:hypothetical protein
MNITNEELVTELEYLIQRGVDDNIKIIFYTILGALQADIDPEHDAVARLAYLCRVFATYEVANMKGKL